MKTLHTIYTSFAKRVAIIFTLFISIGVTSVWGANVTFQRITSTSELTSGAKYLIVYESGKLIFNGSSVSTGANGETTTVTISNNTITCDEAYAFTITSSSSSWKITGSNGKSIGHTGSSNSLTTGSYTNTISFSSNNVVIGCNSRTLRCNPNNGSPLFRYYTSGQQAIQLYKQTAPSTFTVTCQSNNANYGSVSPTSVKNVANNTAISANGNTLTVGATTITATPKEQDANYTYAFSNWSGIPVGGKVTADVTVTANFTSTARALTNYRTSCATETSHFVTFNANGHGTAPTQQTVTSGGYAQEPNDDPSETGYNFQGWYNNSLCTGEPFDFENTPITADITLYAKWTANTYKVTLNTNEGTINSGDISSYTYGVSATLPTDVTKTGYSFAGWYNNSDFTGDPIKTISNIETDNKEYWAKWNPAVYTINYKDQGGADFSGQHEAGHPENHTYNTTTTLKSASKEHYTFDGWYKESDCSGTKVITLGATDYTNNITLYAKWTAKTYTITLDANGGTFVDNRDSQTKGSATFDYIYGTYATYSDAPNLTEYYTDLKRDDYQFDGWVSAGSPWNKLFTSTGNRTIQAQWSKLHTVTFNTGTNNPTIDAIKGTSETGITLPAGPTPACSTDDWEFAGWWTESVAETPTSPGELLTASSNYKPTEDCTLYAVYSKEKTEEGGGATPTVATLSFASTAQRTSFSSTKQVWEQNGITLTNNKSASTSPVADYYNPARFYANSEIIIEAPGNITQIVFDCNNSSYATEMKNSIDVNSDASVSDKKVTLKLDGTSNTYTISSISAQVRIDALTVTYLAESGPTTTTTYNSNPTCDICENILTINKGAETNGTFILSQSGDIETCDGDLVVTVSEISPAEHHSVASVTATNPITGDVPTVTNNGDGTWTVTYNQNSTGESTINVTFVQNAKASITLSELGVPTTDNTTYYVGETYTLPSTSSQSCEGKQLVGWSTVEVAETDTKPTEKYHELGAKVTLAATQTFYAVFAAGSGGGGWQKTDIANISASDEVVVTIMRGENTYALTNNQGASNPPIAEVLNIENDAIKLSPMPGEYQWNISRDGNSLIFYPEGTTATWLYCTNTNNGVRVGTNEAKTFTIDSKSGYLQHNSTSRYLGVYFNTDNGNAQDWRCYDNTTNNIKNQTLIFYKKTSSLTNYSTTCVTPVWEANAATIDKTSFTVNCGGRSSMDGAAQITFSKDKIFGFSNPITIEASEGFLVSTSRTPNENYQQSVSQRPLVGTDYPNTFNGKFVYVRAEAPAQSDTDLEGTITIKNSKGDILQTFSVTADVTCTTYTLTLNDRGTKTTAEYYAGASVPKPEDPTGVCTDPIHYVFDGWAEAKVDEGSTTYTKVSFPYTMPAKATTLYAVYRYVEEGSGDGNYYLVENDLGSQWAGEYLIVSGTKAFDGSLSSLDVTGNNFDVTISNKTIEATDEINQKTFTIKSVEEYYTIQSKSGKYIGAFATGNLNNNTEVYDDRFYHTLGIGSPNNNALIYSNKGDGVELQTNGGRFRYYTKNNQTAVYLYKKSSGTNYFTTSPVCGAHLAITEGKEIYVTGGNAGGTRDLVIAQQKVSYKATRLNVGPTSQVPDVKVATNGITVGGVVTSDVKVIIDQTKEQQTDGTYTITGTITVQYQPSAKNKQEDIQVQLAVDYNTDATDNFTVHARSLPSEFVIVAKSGDKWYALNGDMSTNAANPANGQVTLDNDANPTKATYAPCNAIYTFDGVPNTGDRTYVRFQGTDGAWLWASSGTNVGIQNSVLKTTPEGSNKAYNWKLYTEDNITYRFGNANSSRQLTLSGEKFGMYASGVQDIRILPYDAKCLYNYAPSNLKVSVLKGTYVTLTWDAVAGATKYQYRTNGTTWTDAGTEPTVTITGLEGDTKYTYYIRAYHEDAGVSQECIDYAEITFTTADCDDVPANITYSADLTSITVTWTAVSTNCTVRLYSDEACTSVVKFADELNGSVTFSQLDRNTTYYVRVLAEGTCASPIVPVKTEDVELDIVEWDKDKIYVDINTNEKVSVTLENEVSYGNGSGKKADELFFSKYFEGSGSLKLLAIYNGTGKDIDLSTYRIDRGVNGNGTKVGKSYVLSQLGTIKNGQEIIFYSWPLPASGDNEAEYSYECSRPFLESKTNESGVDANPRWILCDTEVHDGVEFETMDFSGDDPLLLYKGNTLIDVFGVSTAAERPSSKGICSGRSDNCWSATGVSNMDYGKTEADFENGIIPEGVDLLNQTITAYTARVIMFRKNTVVSGNDAVTKNKTDFVTFADEWEARQVCMSGDDGDLTCAAYQELGTFDYSKYYTKFESMGDDQEFDTNKRNSDGTLTISSPELSKQSCRNIKITVKDANGNVLKSQDHKVPIMITTDQETAYTDENKNQNAFYALQENLATVEVDGSGNPTGNKTNLTLEQVREICKTCDVVVRDNATLTKVTDGTTNDHPQVHDVIVYEGASIVIPDGNNHNYTINSLSLRRKGDDVASAQVQGTGKLVLPADVPVTLNMRIDANNWHWFTLPYDCDIADVTWSDGTEAKYNTDWFLMYYDGESRAASTNPHDNHWKVYKGTTIEAGKGYIIGITGNLTHPDYTFELRFPMEQDVLTAEQTNKTVALNAWGVKSDNTPNNKGWNLVGNPYLNYYQPKTTGFSGLSLLKYTDIDPVTGDRLYDDNGNIPFLVTPIDGGWYEYRQDLASDVQMMPFTAYFVQVGDPDTHENGQALDASFEAGNRGKKSIVRRAPSEVDELDAPAIVAVSLTNAKGESDKTTLLIADRFTSEYEMNADFFKWFGDYYTYYTKPVLYTLGADQGKRAFNALNEELATQPVALGMYAAQVGDYTFTLNQKYDLSRVEEVWLFDATENVYINLMQQDYTFSTTKINGEGRFSLSVKMMPKISTEIENIKQGDIWATTRNNEIVVNGLSKGMQLWIYDATGKLLHSDRTTNYQHSYGVPHSGTYFVRVYNNNEAQTIKVVME